MVADEARKWLLTASLVMTAGVFVFFLVAPAVGYPLTFGQARGFLEIIIPVFLGYLGSGSHFIFTNRSQRSSPKIDVSSELAALMIRGPVIVFAVMCVCAIAVFGFSNRIEAPIGSGMSIDMLAGFLSAALGLLAVTTNVAISYLFATGEKRVKAGA
jgi:hypothetical protein